MAPHFRLGLIQALHGAAFGAEPQARTTGLAHGLQ